MIVSEAIMQRKSIRSYTERPVSPDDVVKIVEAGRWAPNAGPYTLSVIRSADLLKRINDLTLQAMLASGNDFLIERASLPGYQPVYGAPVMIILSGPADAPYTQLNVATCAENMLLQATELGLGSCFLRSPAFALNAEENRLLAEEAGIPEGSLMQCAVIVGYTADENKFRRMEREKRGTVIYID
ncbi:MAG TPA: nitroreductase family protein [Thermoleophilia bacterium]|nr:nitroreductase family protein [Thermoleophilia bacterium]